MPVETRELLLSLQTTYASDNDELENLARSLRGELLDTDIADVRSVTAGAPPAGAKAMDAFTWNALRLFLDPAVLGALFSTLTSWVRRNEGTALHLAAGDCVVELKGAVLDSAALQKMLETCLEARQEPDVEAGNAVLPTEHTDAGEQAAKPLPPDVEPTPPAAPPADPSTDPATDPAKAPEPHQPPPTKESDSAAEAAATPDPQKPEDGPEEP